MTRANVSGSPISGRSAAISVLSEGQKRQGGRRTSPPVRITFRLPRSPPKPAERRAPFRARLRATLVAITLVAPSHWPMTTLASSPAERRCSPRCRQRGRKEPVQKAEDDSRHCGETDSKEARALQSRHEGHGNQESEEETRASEHQATGKSVRPGVRSRPGQATSQDDDGNDE